MRILKPIFAFFPFLRSVFTLCYRSSISKMEEIVGNVADIKFDVEVALEEQIGAQSLPFPGMDSK